MYKIVQLKVINQIKIEKWIYEKNLHKTRKVNIVT